jgi:hypothetical protein
MDVAGPGAPARGGNREALVAEATVTVANLLGAAGVTGFQMGSAEDAAKLGADAVWNSGNVIGTIRILENVRIDDPKITGAVIGHSAKSCKGAFLSGSLPEAEDEGKRSLRIFTTCQHNLNTTTVYYFGVPRPKSGIYLFATISAGPPEQVKETDSGLRTAAYRLVK